VSTRVLVTSLTLPIRPLHSDAGHKAVSHHIYNGTVPAFVLVTHATACTFLWCLRGLILILSPSLLTIRRSIVNNGGPRVETRKRDA
jgi:hypothetical protein